MIILLILSTMFEMVCIPLTTEYSIYTNDYYVDDEGNVYEKTDRLDVYEYGDIVIETPTTRYTFYKVYAAYDYCAQILELIKKQCLRSVIHIQLEELNPQAGFRQEGPFEISRNDPAPFLF